MADLKATVRGNIAQCILSAFVFLLAAVTFIFVRGISPLIGIILAVFGAMSIGAIILNLIEMRRAKDAMARILESKGKHPHKVTVQIQKIILLTRPAPKYDEYLICVLLEGPDKETYLYPFPKAIDSSAPIRKSIRLKLTSAPLTLTCLGKTGVVSAIEGFSLDGYPTTKYRPTIFRRK